VKILCEWASCGPAYVRSGWGRVFQACGHDFVFWDRDKKSAFDAFSEQEPDCFLGATYTLDRAVEKCIEARPEMKVALFASAWGPLVDGIDREKYPIVLVTEEEKRRVEGLKKRTGKPDFVFVHVSEKYLLPTLGGWRDAGVKPVGVMNAADTFVYRPVPAKPEFRSQIFFCGGAWGYKSRNLDRFVLPLCESLDVKIFGNRPWKTPSYLGYLPDEDMAVAMCSADVCPNVSEPHSTAPELGFDCVTRPFSVSACGRPCVSDHVDELRECFDEDELWMARTPAEFKEKICHLLENPEEAAELGRRARARVLRDGTYFDRVARMVSEMGLEEEVRKVMAKKAELLGAA